MIHGHCLCEAVRFEVTSPLGPIIHCHCSMCRRASGTAFATNASVRTEGFRVTAGEEQLGEFESSPGHFRVFCRRCGSPLFSRFTQYPIIRVRLGALDDDPGGRAQAHIWLATKAPWYPAVDDGLERFVEMPPVSYRAPG